ncbi:MAG: glycosyltransferase [Flavobacteriales bacterium]|nr:glycosyltransferase [Flavobacteriales bacterium]
MIDNILFYSLLIVSVVHAFFLLINWKFIFSKPIERENSDIGVSVVVCAKNEEKNIAPLLESLKNQNYSNFEIVLVNDASRDKTRDIFEEYADDNSNATVVNVEENDVFWRGKKFALTMGIKRAKNNRVLLTDADCVPVSKNWISSMMKGYSEGKEFVLGYGAYRKSDGLVNRLVRFETILTASNYFSYAKFFTPYMGVGRNLSYTKKIFLDNKGFFGHMDVASGDDDLFINKNATKKNTEIIFSEESKTLSDSPSNWNEWFVQKRRHYSTSQHYSTITKSLLGLQGISHAAFFVLITTMLILNIDVLWVLSILAIRTVIMFVTVSMSAAKLGEKDLIVLVPLLDIILIILQLGILFSNQITTPKRWA